MITVILTTGKDAGLASLLERYDPYHKMWEASNGKPILLIDGKTVTVH